MELLTAAKARTQTDVITDTSVAFHMDIGHIIPASANTMLFELLLVGLLRDPASCRMYHRQARDSFHLEIPNSPGNKTAKALRFCSLLPTTVLSVDADSLDLETPIFRDAPLCSEVALVEYTEMKFVCRWLKAVRRC